MGRARWRRRSRTTRRTSSSFERSSTATLRSSIVALRRIGLRASGLGPGAWELPEAPGPSPEAPLQAPHRAHFFAAISPAAETTPKSCPRSTSTTTASSTRRASSESQLKYSRRFPLNRTSKTCVKSLLGQSTHGKVLFFAAFEELVDPVFAQLTEMALQGVAERRRGGFGIRVCAPGRLGNDLVDHSEVEQVLGGNLESFRGALTLARILPQNRGTPFRRDHGIHRVLEHQHTIGEPDRERPARAAFADDRGNDRGLQRRHFDQTTRDRLGLAPLFRAEPRVGAWRIDKRNDGGAEFGG